MLAPIDPERREFVRMLHRKGSFGPLLGRPGHDEALKRVCARRLLCYDSLSLLGAVA
jgi:hypothetical protein